MKSWLMGRLRGAIARCPHHVPAIFEYAACSPNRARDDRGARERWPEERTMADSQHRSERRRQPTLDRGSRRHRRSPGGTTSQGIAVSWPGGSLVGHQMARAKAMVYDDEQDWTGSP